MPTGTVDHGDVSLKMQIDIHHLYAGSNRVAFRGCYVQASMELGREDVSLLERCPHFRGCYVQASMELGPEDVSY